MDSFLELFGAYTIADAVTVIAVIVFIGGLYFTKIKPSLSNKYKKDEEINEIVEHYQEWRQQSLDIQKQLTDSINELRQGQEKNTRRLEKMDEDNKKREINRLRDRLLQSYRYYTSLDKNPLQAWSEMESDAFWKIFNDYEELKQIKMIIPKAVMSGSGSTYFAIEKFIPNIEGYWVMNNLKFIPNGVQEEKIY